MGFHWLYDQQRIRQLAPEAPEFHTPNSADYSGFNGYFAHAGKRAGECSQYGHQAMVMLRCLAAGDGRYDSARFETEFAAHFGYGGTYVGYIDRATRDTLNNIAAAEKLAVERALSVPFTGPAEVQQRLLTKVLACSKQTRGQARREQLEQATRITDNADALVEHALSMLDAWEGANGCPGSADVQLSATAKLPALIACYSNAGELNRVVESAIRITNNNDTAVNFGLAATAIIDAAIQTGDIKQVAQTARNTRNPVVCQLMCEALDRIAEPSTDVTKHFGMSCDLAFGLPAVAHNAVSSSGYQQAIRENIYAGGDSCGRAIVLGAILGACYGPGGKCGIPEGWLARLSCAHETRQLIG